MMGKRELPSSPAWSLEDTQDEFSSVSYLVSSKKEELAKKLFYEVNKQSLCSMLQSSFMKPQRLTQAGLKTGHKVLGDFLGKRRLSQEIHVSKDTKEINQKASFFERVEKLTKAFQQAYSQISSSQESSYFKKINHSLLEVISKLSKENKKVHKIIKEQSPEEIALALLTLSSKKAKIHKNLFVELAGAISCKKREDLLSKGKCYFVLVWLLEGQKKSLDDFLQGRHLH